MPIPDFTINTYRYDPYKNFRFRLKWKPSVGTGAFTYVAGISRISGLSRVTQVVRHRSGGDPSTPRLSPAQTEYGPITLERGVTHDKSFEIWANKIWDYTNSTQGEGTAQQLISLADFRKDLVIELYNEAGQLAISYNVFRCWVSEYQPLPELDANGGATAIQMIKLENEGWERDYTITEPTQTNYDLPSS